LFTWKKQSKGPKPSNGGSCSLRGNDVENVGSNVGQKMESVGEGKGFQWGGTSGVLGGVCEDQGLNSTMVEVAWWNKSGGRGCVTINELQGPLEWATRPIRTIFKPI